MPLPPTPYPLPPTPYPLPATRYPLPATRYPLPPTPYPLPPTLYPLPSTLYVLAAHAPRARGAPGRGALLLHVPLPRTCPYPATSLLVHVGCVQ